MVKTGVKSLFISISTFNKVKKQVFSKEMNKTVFVVFKEQIQNKNKMLKKHFVVVFISFYTITFFVPK